MNFTWVQSLILSLSMAAGPFFAVLVPAQAHAQACFDIFRASEHPEAMRALNLIVNEKEMTYERAAQTPEYALIQKLTLAKLKSIGAEVSYGVDPTGKYIYEIRVTPSEKSDLNRMAKHLWDTGKTEVVIPLMENLYASSYGHQYRIEPAGHLHSIYSISLLQLFDQGWSGRQRFHRHEMRHRQFRKIVVDQVKAGKPIPITTGSIMRMEGDSFPESVRVSITLLNRHDKNGTMYTHEMKLSHYRSFLSLEEMWTYLRDMQVEARSLSAHFKRATKADLVLAEKLNEFLYDLEMVAHIYFRIGQIETWSPVDFFTTSLSRDMEINLRGNVTLDQNLFNMIDHTFYDSKVETGNMLLVTPGNSKYIISLPLEAKGKSSLDDMRLNMLTRLVKTAKIAAEGASGIFEGFLRLGHSGQKLLSENDKVREAIKPSELKEITSEIDILLAELTRINKAILEANEDPFKPNYNPSLEP